MQKRKISLQKTAGIICIVIVCCISGFFLGKFSAKASTTETWGDYTYYYFKYDASAGAILTKYSGKETNIKIPAKVNGHVVKQLDGTFRDNKKIQTVTMPDSITYVNRAFQGCSKLESVKMSRSMEHIGSGTFRDCIRLKKVSIPKQVKVISSFAFCNCRSIKELVIPEGVISLESHTFDNCIKLKQITIEGAIDYIGSKAFFNCQALKAIHLPDTVKVISNYAFMNCRSLREFHFPEGLTEVGIKAFADCQSLPAIYLGKQVMTVDDYAFLNCIGVKTKEINSDNIQYGKGVFNAKITGTYEGFDYYYYLEDKEVRLTAYHGKEKNVVIPSQIEGCPVVILKRGIFEKNETIESLVIPDCVTTLQYCICWEASNLKTVQLSSGMTNIPSGMFGYCTNLKEIVIPDSVTTIGENAFEGCTSLKEIVIPNNVTIISRGTYDGCTSLEKVTFPRQLEAIHDFAFRGCARLNHVRLGNKVKKIEMGAFDDCYSLSDYSIESKEGELGDNAEYTNYAFGGTPLNHVTAVFSDQINGTVLRSKSGSVLKAAIPVNGICKIPEGVENTERFFVTNTDKLKRIEFPATMKRWSDVTTYSAKQLCFKGKQPPEIRFTELYKWTSYMENNGTLNYNEKGEYIGNSVRVKTILIPKKYKKNYTNWLKEEWGYKQSKNDLRVKTYH